MSISPKPPAGALPLEHTSVLRSSDPSFVESKKKSVNYTMIFHLVLGTLRQDKTCALTAYTSALGNFTQLAATGFKYAEDIQELRDDIHR